MLCDRQSHRVGARKHTGKILEVEVFDTAGYDSENRELCYSCICLAINDGHQVNFPTQDVEDEFFLSATWTGSLELEEVG
jgi:hypothetical protein